MATVTRYWRTDSTTGGDGTEDRTDGATRAYESLSAAVGAEAVDLVSAGNILHLICTTGGEDTTAVDITGYTTDASNYIIIECQGAARNNGISRENSGTSYQIKTSTNPALRNRQTGTQIIGVESTQTTLGSAAFNTLSTGTVDLSDCLFGTTATGSSSGYLVINAGAHTTTWTNCLVIAETTRAFDLRNGTNTIDHCGFATSQTLGVLVDDGSTVTNSWSNGASTECWWTGGTAPSGSHNASSDGSAATDYTNTVTNFTASSEFTNPTVSLSTADYTLLDSSLNAAGTGSLADDIADDTRTGTADIGPFNYGAAGPAGDNTIIIVPTGPALS